MSTLITSTTSGLQGKASCAESHPILFKLTIPDTQEVLAKERANIHFINDSCIARLEEWIKEALPKSALGKKTNT